MYDFNTKRAILTRTFTRYGGDFDWTVSLIVIPKAGSRMSCVYLMFQGDGDPLLKHITSDGLFLHSVIVDLWFVVDLNHLGEHLFNICHACFPNSCQIP